MECGRVTGSLITERYPPLKNVSPGAKANEDAVISDTIQTIRFSSGSHIGVIGTRFPKLDVHLWALWKNNAILSVQIFITILEND
ncbi:hypothetical protein WN55_08531 [Dufourea novaeangliae]|uniref:Uncharacterized protein n=1 Tax=Dufourea novaeangliae TaxID=178035 RepID=A0A154P5E4_DUFNO|nr:hypothetical protein WN55_08531 [Dufourea novaeangliae]